MGQASPAMGRHCNLGDDWGRCLDPGGPRAQSGGWFIKQVWGQVLEHTAYTGHRTLAVILPLKHFLPVHQSIPPDEQTAAISGAMSGPPFFWLQNNRDDYEGEDSLGDAGAQSLDDSTWAFMWSNTSSAARQQEEEEAEEAKEVAAATVTAVMPGADSSGGNISAAEGLRRRLGKFRAPPPSDEESGGGKPSGEGKEDEVEDEAGSSSYSDLKRGKRFKKLSKLLCSVQVRMGGAVVRPTRGWWVSPWSEWGFCRATRAIHALQLVINKRPDPESVNIEYGRICLAECGHQASDTGVWMCTI